MRPALAYTRFRTNAVPAGLRRSAWRALARAAGSLARGRVEAAWVDIEEAHETTRNAGLLHTAAHGARLIGMLARGRPGAAVAEVRLALMATPIAWTRRAAGVPNEAPGGQGLRTTWRGRR